jgi:hypothetical protein
VSTRRSEDVPGWLSIESIEGTCPVQAWGKCGAWSWYFRARWDRWSLGAALGAMDPVDVGASSDDTFHHEERYGDGPYDAGYMSVDEARWVIVRELSRLRAERPW